MDNFEIEPITFEEYEAAYRRFVACLNETGVEVTERGLDPFSRQFEYWIPDPDPESRKPPSDDCYEREFFDADRRWQFQQQEPLHDAETERAIAFFTSRGVTDIPEEFISSGNIGGMVMYAQKKLGHKVVHDYSEMESAREASRRVASLSTVDAPPPWKSVATIDIDALLAAGFADDGQHCLVVSAGGRLVVDTSSGEVVEREEIEHDCHADIESTMFVSGVHAEGIGPLSGVSVPIAGIWGGGLSTGGLDDWRVQVCSPEWPISRVILHEPGAHIYGSAIGLHQIANGIPEVRAAGFSNDGQYLLVASGDGLRLWVRSKD